MYLTGISIMNKQREESRKKNLEIRKRMDRTKMDFIMEPKAAEMGGLRVRVTAKGTASVREILSKLYY